VGAAPISLGIPRQKVPRRQSLTLIMPIDRRSHYQANNHYKGCRLVVHPCFVKLPGLKETIIESQEMLIDADALHHPDVLVAQLYVPVSSNKAFVQLAFSFYQHIVAVESLDGCHLICSVGKSGSIKGVLLWTL
jgi:hypothetical protein